MINSKKKQATKPTRIKILQYIFLIFTLIAFWDTARSYTNPFTVTNSYDLFVIITFQLLPLTMLIGITYCLFKYTKKSMAYVMPFAVVLAISEIFLMQYFLLSLFSSLLGINLAKAVSPEVAKLSKYNSSELATLISIGGVLGGIIVYGIPSLLLFVLHKLIKQ